MQRHLLIAGLGATLLAGVAAIALYGAKPAQAQAQNQTRIDYTTQVAPLFAKYCQGCHSGAEPRGDVNLRFRDEAHVRSYALSDDDLLGRVATEVGNKVMPPANVRNQPTAAERQLLVDWIRKDALTAGTPDPGPFVAHRLNNREFANTIRDVLYLPADYNAAENLPADERGDGFDNNAGTLTVSPLLIEKYLLAVRAAVMRAFRPEKEVRDQTLATPNRLNDPSATYKVDFANRAGKVRVNIEAFAPRAWRRPVSKAEIDELMKFADLAFTHDGEAFDKATALVIRATLMSPNFLFRVEENPQGDGTNKVFALSEHQLAARLSYFLWSTMPDEALTAAANKGALRSGLDAEVVRMLKDPKARSLTRDFLGQWLEIRSLKETPNAAPELLAAMQGETEVFFDYIVRENRPITDFLAADYTFVNETLAKHYGIAGVTGPEFRKVAVDGKQRGGIFTQASFLTLTSKPLGDGRRTSPVQRGKFILENIFNQRIPPPPPNVPTLALDSSKELKGTVRQIFEQHRANPVCAGCHARMDPYGFALENYDGTGKWRVQDNGVNVDTSGEIAGRKFTTPVEFRALLAARTDDFRTGLVRKMLSYALGRALQGYDRPAVEQIVAQVKQGGDTFNAVILAIVKSYTFQNARGSVVTAGDAAPLRKASLEK